MTWEIFLERLCRLLLIDILLQYNHLGYKWGTKPMRQDGEDSINGGAHSYIYLRAR